MGPEIGRYIADQMFKLIVAAFIIGGTLMAALIFGIPWLWNILKPWLHSITG